MRGPVAAVALIALALSIVSPVVAVSRASGRALDGSADPSGRWIVVLEPGTDAPAAANRQGRRIGFRAERTYRTAVRGYAARLDGRQVATLRADPTVAQVVPDERIELTAQVIPTGISRIGDMGSVVSRIDGVDGPEERVDADVAIVDTGIASVPDLNVAGGYGCSNSKTTIWIDNNGHGTHVAGTVGAIDNGTGVVGVAPGVRLWAVKILNDSGEGLLSWYICGLDWIASQRDPNDPSRPLFEAANMSVAKWGTDDGACGMKNKDILHAAICRVVASGVTVVAAAGNDHGSAAKRVPAAYNEVITVSALADTDGLPGGLGGRRCLSWGSYDVDDTFADFSNYGSDVDLIAPGKCIWSTVPGGYAYSSGTSMAAPHVTGAVALLKASRPQLTPAEVREALIVLGNAGWKTSTDPDSAHEPLLDVSRIGARGTFTIAAGRAVAVRASGGTARFAIRVVRSATSFERIRLTVAGLPDGASAVFAPGSLIGLGTSSSTLSVTVPPNTPPGSYPLTVAAVEHDLHRATTALLVVGGS
jgi:subtilisin family serine protease